MVELTFGNWLKAEDFPESKELTVQFIDEGVIGEYKDKSGETKPTFEIGVQFQRDGKVIQRRWTMNYTSQTRVVKKLGAETKDWKGKTADLITRTETVGAKDRNVIYAKEEQ